MQSSRGLISGVSAACVECNRRSGTRPNFFATLGEYPQRYNGGLGPGGFMNTTPPILHRKETFVGQQHPLYERFARLTPRSIRDDRWPGPDFANTTRRCSIFSAAGSVTANSRRRRP